MLFSEYVLTPSIFSKNYYCSDVSAIGSDCCKKCQDNDCCQQCCEQIFQEYQSEICRVYLYSLISILLEEAIVIDLYDGKWRDFTNRIRGKHPMVTKHIIKELYNRGQLVSVQRSNQTKPSDDIGWCQEALAFDVDHQTLRGIITSRSTKERFKDQQKISAIEDLYTFDKDLLPNWWVTRSSSVRIQRKMDSYLSTLTTVFKYSASLRFIDPYIDPIQDNYRQFYEFIQEIGRLNSTAEIEIHVCRVKNARLDSGEKIPDFEEYFERYKKDFVQEMNSQLSGLSINLNVFIWRKKFHDRYLISNWSGISLPYGFDVDIENPTPTYTTWTRISQLDREKIDNEFDTSPTYKTQYRSFRFDVA